MINTITDNRMTELQSILDEFEHECFMLRVEASETYAKDDIVRKSYERVRDEFARHIITTLENELELIDLAHNAWSMALCAMQGMPIPASWGNVVEKGLRERGIDVDELPYVVPDVMLGGGKLTTKQVREAIERHSAWVIGDNRCFHDGAYEEIADELNVTLSGGSTSL